MLRELVLEVVDEVLEDVQRREGYLLQEIRFLRVLRRSSQTAEEADIESHSHRRGHIHIQQAQVCLRSQPQAQPRGA